MVRSEEVPEEAESELLSHGDFVNEFQTITNLNGLDQLAVVFAISLADLTNCLLATGLGVLEEAR